HAVAADQRTAFDVFAGVERDADVITVILESVDTSTGFKRNQIAALAGFKEGAVYVGAVGDPVGLPKSFQESLAQRDIRDQFSGQGVPHFLCGRTMSVRQDRVLETDFFQDAENIRSELDASPDLTEFRRLLENPNRKSLIGKRVSGDEAADATAANQEGGGTAICTRHGPNPQFRERSDWMSADHKT